MDTTSQTVASPGLQTVAQARSTAATAARLLRRFGYEDGRSVGILSASSPLHLRRVQKSSAATLAGSETLHEVRVAVEDGWTLLALHSDDPLSTATDTPATMQLVGAPLSCRSGSWYYEVHILSEGPMEVGWIMRDHTNGEGGKRDEGEQQLAASSSKEDPTDRESQWLGAERRGWAYAGYRSACTTAGEVIYFV